MPSETISPARKPLVIVVRHGRTTMNKSGVVRAWEDPALAPEGKLDAQVAGNKIKFYRPKMVYSSDFNRDTETAGIIALICGNIPTEVDYGLRTANLGMLSGQKVEAVRDRTIRWYQNPFEPAPSGEAFADFGRGFMRAMEPKIELARELEHFRPTVIVTHGKNLAYLDHYYNGMVPEKASMALPGGFGVIYSNMNGLDSFEFMGPTEPVIEDK